MQLSTPSNWKPCEQFRFLNIGSAFPRKGIDILLGAYFSEFHGTENVSLILKSFPNPHNQVAELFDNCVRNIPTRLM